MEIQDYNMIDAIVMGDHTCGYTEGMHYLHKHTHYEISVVVQGKLKVINNNDTVNCQGPCVILHFPGSVHTVISDPKVLYERYNINFHAEVFRHGPSMIDDAEQLFVSNISLLMLTEDELSELVYYLKPLVAEKRGSEEKRERLLSVILSILKHCRFENSPKEKRPSSGCVNRAIVCIAEKSSPLVTANELADELKISRAKLTADFKRETGMTLKDYIELQCVERAKLFLLDGCSVNQTSDLLGHADVGTFIRVFKKVTGVTPGKYAKRRENSRRQ